MMIAHEEQVAFRPRYSADESSNEAYAEDLRQQRLHVKKRRVYAVIILIIGFIAITVIFRIYYFVTGRGIIIGRMRIADHGSTSRQNSLAMKESFGLFDNIPNSIWKQKKAASKKAVKQQNKIMTKSSNMLSESGANIDESKWWKQNWLPNFSCDHKQFIGGKWICEPSRIIDLADDYNTLTRIIDVSDEESSNVTTGRKKKKNRQRGRKECLIYISGGNDVEFGQQFSSFMEARMAELHKDSLLFDTSLCEIHIFNHFVDPTLLENMLQQVNGIHIHPFGFRPENKESMGVAGDGSVTAFKTFKETLKELGHRGKNLAILAIDCEGCEWDIYKEVLSSDITVQQILFQMHGTPHIANQFFTEMHNEGYAIFHREKVGESVYDYSFLKLKPSYFGSTKPRLREEKESLST